MVVPKRIYLRKSEAPPHGGRWMRRWTTKNWDSCNERIVFSQRLTDYASINDGDNLSTAVMINQRRSSSHWVAAPFLVFLLTSKVNLCGVCAFENNKAGYTAQDAPSTRLKITRDGRTYGRTYGPTDGRTDGRTHPHIEMRRATAHLKTRARMVSGMSSIILNPQTPPSSVR